MDLCFVGGMVRRDDVEWRKSVLLDSSVREVVKEPSGIFSVEQCNQNRDSTHTSSTCPMSVDFVSSWGGSLKDVLLGYVHPPSVQFHASMEESP